MTDATSKKPSLWTRISDNWHICLVTVVLLLIIGAVINLNLLTRYEQQEIIQEKDTLTKVLDKLQVPAETTLAPENTPTTIASIPEPMAITAQPAATPQATATAPMILSTITSTHPVINQESQTLNTINNELATVEVLLSAQQFPTVLQLLTSIDAQVNPLPADKQNLLHSTINSDKQRIQLAQSEREQLLGQLQQLQQHINQQLMTGITAKVTPEAPTTQLTFKERIKQKWSDAVQVTRTESTPVNTTTQVPDVYVAVMLQLSLQQAQFALERGDWVGYQSALQSVQMWLTTANIAWLPNAVTLSQTLNSLAKQPSPFVNANVHATRAALTKVNQELTP